MTFVIQGIQVIVIVLHASIAAETRQRSLHLLLHITSKDSRQTPCTRTFGLPEVQGTNEVLCTTTRTKYEVQK